MTYVYDIETFPNFFSVIFKNYKTKEFKEFVVYKDRNDLEELIDFIDNPHLWLVGYNSFNYDNQILKYLVVNKGYLTSIQSDHFCGEINTLSDKIVNDEVREYMFRLPFKSLDLMKIGNLSQKSLKLVGTVMKWPKLQDLPYEMNHRVEPEEVNNILLYNRNDVEITEKLFELLEPAIKLRFNVAKQYDVDVYSESDSGIANRLLEKFYSESTGLDKSFFKKLRTRRGKMFFADVILPDIWFQTKQMNDFLTKLRKTIIFEQTPFMKKSFILHGTKYIMGIGGLNICDPVVSNYYEKN